MIDPTRFLTDFPTLVADVEVELVDGTGRDTGRSGKPGSRPPMPISAVSDIHEAFLVLTDWSRDWASMFDYRPPRPYLLDVCEWLNTHWERAREQHPAADVFADEIRTHYRQVQTHLGHETRKWLPLPGRWDCPITLDDGTACGYELREHQLDRVIHCFRCGTSWTVDEYERLGIILGCELEVTIVQAAALSRVSTRTVERWIASDALPSRTDDTGRRWVNKQDLALVAARQQPA